MRKRRRATIVDVARHAGVSKGLVSFVVNDRPGVAPATRERILASVRELGWHPSQTARSLATERADAVGFVLARPAALLAADPFFPAFVAGIESELSARNASLVLQVVADLDAELEVYRRMAADHRVDGVLLADLRVDDPRPSVLAELGLPAVTLGRPDGRAFLPGRGARRRARGRSRRSSTSSASAIDVSHSSAVPTCSSTRDIGATPGVRRSSATASPRTWRSTATSAAESGAAATAELLGQPARRRPTAIVFANDLMAIAGMSAAVRLGRRVPDDLSIVGFDDIAVAAHMHPALTTVAQDALAWGRAATRAVFDLVELGVDDDRALPAARLVVRGSTAPVARRPPTGARPSKPDSSSPAAHRSAPPGRSGSTRRKS